VHRCTGQNPASAAHRPSPHAGQAGGSFVGAMQKVPQDPHISSSIRPTVIELNELICMS
jgi:hypothetical protein